MEKNNNNAVERKNIIIKTVKKIFTKEYIKSIFVQNFRTKLLAVVLAVIFWFVIVSGQIVTSNISVPVNLINSPKDYMAVSSVQNVSVLVRGPKSLLDNLKYTSIILNIDVSTFPIGDSNRRIIPSDFKSPVGVEVTEVIPDNIEVTVDEVLTRVLTVIPTFLGDTPEGFKVASITTKPDKVTVTGVKSKIFSMSSINTFQINLSDTNTTPTKEIGFVLPDGVKSVKPLYSDVTIRLAPIIERQDYTNIAVTCSDLSDKFQLADDIFIKNIRLVGRVDLLKKFIETSSFSIDCSEIKKAGIYYGEVNIQSVVENVNVVSIKPEKIKYEIRDAKILRD